MGDVLSLSDTAHRLCGALSDTLAIGMGSGMAQMRATILRDRDNTPSRIMGLSRRARTMELEWQQLREQIRQKIAAAGQAVQLVYLTEQDPPGPQPFMYTIGNHHFGLPELLIVDTDLAAFADVLNRLGKIQRDRGSALADEERVDIGGRFPLRIVDAGEIGRTGYATFVGIYYGTRDYEVRQVLLPDTNGRWPDTPGCDLPYARQPVLSKTRRRDH